jgi:N-acetylmuramoyl-L-alanine amidase
MMKIVLNPGHLSTDDRGFLGTETEGGNNKKTVALIKKYLDDYDCEVVIVAQDDGVPFSQLGLKHPDATLFYSHHTNAYNGKARGTEVFFHYGRSLAENIAQRTAEILQTVTRGEKGAKKNNNYFAVINQAVRAGVKYQLMGEIGFHDNPKENKLMIEKRDEIAQAIGEEIVKYLKLNKKEVKQVADKKKDLDIAQRWIVDNGIMQDMKWDEPATRHQMAWWFFDFHKKFIKGDK